MNESIDNTVVLPRLFNKEIYAVEDKKSSESAFQFSGKSLSSILILTGDKKNEFFSSESFQKLEEIITKGLKLAMDDVAIVNIYKNESCNFIHLQKQFLPKNIIAFGVLPTSIRLHIDAPLCEVIDFADCKMIFAETMETYISNIEKKKKLWLALQIMFGLNQNK